MKGPKYKRSCPKCGSVDVALTGCAIICKNCHHAGRKQSFKGLSGHRKDDRMHDHYDNGRVERLPGSDEQ